MAEQLHARALQIGTAAEHLVIADIMLIGYTAFLAGAQLPYDVVLDLDGKLLRIAVKSSLIARPRPAREGSRVCYQFSATRSSRLASGKTVARPYTSALVDMMAFVALDIRRVAYAAFIGTFPTMWHIDPPGDYVPSLNRFGPKHPRITRKKFDDFGFNQALAQVQAHG